jgi:low affinity Fe/Cu permease
MKPADGFDHAAQAVAHAVASPLAFAAAVAVVLLWAMLGPFLGYSEPWQLVINTGTTIVTFLLMFVLQSTQTRDTKALQLKLDELIKAAPAARDELRHADERPSSEIDALRANGL